mmetsp:Transcript_10736/g.36022  ORF Transcript_10736/g.36022 Transcript_10736/m.36022 type:complete len:159 (+) Transcript_10736:548-1024(+)
MQRCPTRRSYLHSVSTYSRWDPLTLTLRQLKVEGSSSIHVLSQLRRQILKVRHTHSSSTRIERTISLLTSFLLIVEFHLFLIALSVRPNTPASAASTAKISDELTRNHLGDFSPSISMDLDALCQHNGAIPLQQLLTKCASTSFRSSQVDHASLTMSA